MHFPLVSHTSLQATIAYRKDTAVSVSAFLTDVARLAKRMPAQQYVLNLCRDRYHFAVGLAAAIVRQKVSLLPPTHTAQMLDQLRNFSEDTFCLHDCDCDVPFAKLAYAAEPDTEVSESSQEQSFIPQIDRAQLIAIVFTSGSTGAPVPHKKHWGMLVKNIQAQAERLQMKADDCHAIVGTIPPQHMYGFESTILLPMLSGQAICGEQPFYAADICETLSLRPAPRVLVSTPLHLRMLLESQLPIPKLALVLSATAPLSESLAQTIETQTQAPLLEIYGSTETGQVATRRSAHTSHWQLFPNVTFSQQGDKTYAEGGHVEAKVVMNDVIELVDAKHFTLHGRTQDLINIAGKRNSLANLNYHLNNIEGVLDGAFYMPDEQSHDHITRLAACVVAPSLKASDIMTALRVCMDPIFLPRPLVFVDALPRNSTGKLPREALQQLFAEHAKLNTKM